jgi:hypothetical protein
MDDYKAKDLWNERDHLCTKPQLRTVHDDVIFLDAKEMRCE